MTAVTRALHRMLWLAIAAGLLLTVLPVSVQIPHAHAAPGSVEHDAEGQTRSSPADLHWNYHGQPHDLDEHDHSQELIQRIGAPGDTRPTPTRPVGWPAPAASPPVFEIDIPPRV